MDQGQTNTPILVKRLWCGHQNLCSETFSPPEKPEMSPGEWSVHQSPGLISYYWRKIKVSEQEFRWPHQNHLTRVPRKFNDKTLGSWITNSILFVEKWGNVILQNSCRTYSRCSLLLCTTLHTYWRDDRNSYYANVKSFLLSWTNLFSWSYLFLWFWYEFLCKFLMISS